MSKKKHKGAEETKVEVDMVPLIDIISLLLMFLIIVGDTAAVANAIKMKLPRASEAKTDKELQDSGYRMEGRIVVQLKNDNGTYRAVINNKAYDLVQGGTGGANRKLLDKLEEDVRFAVGKGMAKKDETTGAVDMSVKLRCPDDAPMEKVEEVIMTLSRCGLVNIQYAAENAVKL